MGAENLPMRATWSSERYLDIECVGGYISCALDRPSGWFTIADVEVKPELRGNGIGKRLIRAAWAEAVNQGATEIIAGIVSRECLEAMRRVFGPDHLHVQVEGTFEGSVPPEAVVNTQAFLHYTVPQL